MTRFADLTTDQQRALLLAEDRTASATAEIVDVDLNLVRDITDRLDQSSAQVQWNGGDSNTVHRGCSVTLALADGDFDWSTQMLRLSLTLTDDRSGLSATEPVGVFVIDQPPTSTGAKIDDPTSPNNGLTSVQCTGKDVTSVLDRQVGYSLTIPGGADPGAVNVLDAAVLAAGLAGFASTAILTDGSRAGQPLSQSMVWPLIPRATSANDPTPTSATNPDATTNTPKSGPTTWRTVVNNILAQVGYLSVWADGAGLLRATPYVDPVNAVPAFTFDRDGTLASLSPVRTRTLNVNGVNKWTFIWSNMPNDSSGNAVVADDDGSNDGSSGIYRQQNDATGPSSIQARGGVPRGVNPDQVSLTAATQADFVAQADRIVADAGRVVTSVTASTVPYPLAGHFDVLTVNDPDLLGGAVQVQATSWTLPLNGSDMSWTWQRVV